MPWKINARGVFDYHEHSPERIKEVDPPNMVAFGVKIESRYGQAAELACMLRFVCALQDEQPVTVLIMDSVFWDSDCCTATVTMRNTTPGNWLKQSAAQMAEAFWRVGRCRSLSVKKPGCAPWEFRPPKSDVDELEFIDEELPIP